MEPIFEIKEKTKKENYAKFAISPMISGFGDTMGTAIRRVLLTSLPGAAITKVKINSVKHQFSSIKGVKEDALDFLLNLKKVRFQYDGDKPAKISLSVNKPGEVKAADLTVPAGVKVVNPDLVLANLSKGTKLDAKMEVETGIGYSAAEDRKEETLGLIPLDASFSPVVRVNYKVEETRVGRLTNYDKLVLEIWTDGTIAPRDAFTKASEILISYFNQVVNPKKVENKVEAKEPDGLGSVGNLSVEEIGLPTRVANALSKAGYETVEKLVNAKVDDLTKVRNLGEKSISIISEALAQKGVKFNA